MMDFKPFIVIILVGLFLFPGWAQSDNYVTVSIDRYEWVGKPRRTKEDLKRRVEEACREVETEFLHMEGGIGSYYEYYTSVGKLLLLRLELDRIENPSALLSLQQRMIAMEIKDNFQKRIHFLSNAVQVGASNRADLCRLKINAIIFERALVQEADTSSRFTLLNIQERIVREAQSLLKTLREQIGVYTTTSELESAEKLLQIEEQKLEAIRKKVNESDAKTFATENEPPRR